MSFVLHSMLAAARGLFLGLSRSRRDIFWTRSMAQCRLALRGIARRKGSRGVQLARQATGLRAVNPLPVCVSRSALHCPFLFSFIQHPIFSSNAAGEGERFRNGGTDRMRWISGSSVRFPASWVRLEPGHEGCWRRSFAAGGGGADHHTPSMSSQGSRATSHYRAAWVFLHVQGRVTGVQSWLVGWILTFEADGGLARSRSPLQRFVWFLCRRENERLAADQVFSDQWHCCFSMCQCDQCTYPRLPLELPDGSRRCLRNAVSSSFLLPSCFWGDRLP